MALQPIHETWKPLPTGNIRYKGIWDMDDLYQFLIDWFRKRKYVFYEVEYKHKTPNPFGANREYYWIAERREGEWETVKYHIYMHLYDAQVIPKVINGKKRNFMKGRLWIQLNTTIYYDYEKNFDSNYFYRNLKNFLNNYIFKKKFMKYLSPKYRWEAYLFHAKIRERLHMEISEYHHEHSGGVHVKTGGLSR